MLFGLCSAAIVLSLLLGGGTHSGFLGDVAAQAATIPLVAVALWPAFDQSGPRRINARKTLALCLVCAGVVAIQMFPLPFDFWDRGASLFADPKATGAILPVNAWSTFSLTPDASWAAAASLIVPLALFGATLQIGFENRLLLAKVILGVGALSLLLGFVQFAGGAESGLRFYEVTNPTEAVGFFANRNHFAALLNTTLILCGLWLAETIETPAAHEASKSRDILWFSAAAVFLVAVLTGLFMTRSRAGVILALPALLGIAAMIGARSTKDGRAQGFWRKDGRIAAAVILFALSFAIGAGSSGVLTRFESGVVYDLRIPLTRTTLETLPKALPFGTGLGSFPSVYAAVERDAAVNTEFANRAHDDVAEFLLETGLLGVVMGVYFLVWFGARTFAVWAPPPCSCDRRQVLLERASTLIVALLLLHSLVDYPLRTTALSAVFAFFCAILAAPAPPAPVTKPARRSRSNATSAKTIVRLDEGENLHWPDTWRR
jgi:O-antigen ligase